jgi:D-alanine-D-alanine ligase
VNEEDPLILFLYNIETCAPSGEARDLIALQETASVAMQLIEALHSRGYSLVPLPVQESLDDLRKALKPFSPKTAFVFNYCDGFAGSNMAATKIVRLLDNLGFKHTGSTAETVALCIDKSRAKRRLIAHGIATPRYQTFTQPAGFYRYNFPAIVKPVADDASIGIDVDSVVTTPTELWQRVEYVIRCYHQAALVEEYIPGREFSVSVWGNDIVRTLPITEMDYSSISDPLRRILTYDSKWNPDSYDYQHTPTRCPARLNPNERTLLAETAIRTYRAIGLRDYGRVDIRYHNGIPYVIDINEIPDLSPDSGFPNAARVAGYTYAEMAEQILLLALERENWQWQRPTLKSLSPRLQMVNTSSD